MSRVWMIGFLLAILFSGQNASAQSHAEQFVSLTTGKREAHVIEEPSQDTTFTVPLSGEQSSLMIWVAGAVPLSLEIRDPSGQVLETGTLELKSLDDGDQFSIYPNVYGAYQWGAILDTTGTTYVEVVVNRNNNPGTVGVVISTHADRDPLGATLIASTDERLGGIVGFSMFVFEDGIPCSGDVTLLITKPDDTTVSMSLYDDGAGIDPVANDGSYSGAYLVEVAGEHNAYAEYTGSIPSGVPAVKLGDGTSFIAEPGLNTIPSPPLMLDPLPWSVHFEYVDTNNNGKYEQVYLIYEATLFKDDEGLEYKLLTSISPIIEDVVHLPIAVTFEMTCTMSSNQFRILLPMGQLAAVGSSGKLRVNTGTARSITTGSQVQIYDGGEESEYINFAQIELCPADVNQDWLVTPADFSAWLGAYNTGDPSADANGDGQVSPADFSSWIGHYDSGC